MANFATYTDLRDRFDERVIARYASDSGTPTNISGLATNRRVAAALLDATARITSACVKGNRYSRATLDTLAADSDKGALLRQMTCALAMAQLLAGRVSGVDEIEEIVFGYKDALSNLDALQNGKLLFDLSGAIDASLPHSSDGPTNPYDLNRITLRNPMFGRWEWRS
jgi:phage gp36-like protein